MDYPYRKILSAQPPAIPQGFEFRFLQQEHLPELMAVQEQMQSQLKHPDQYVPLSEQEFFKMLGEQGLVLGTYAAGRLIGMHAILFPHDQEDNLGRDVGLEHWKQEQVAHLEGVFVLPEYRGTGLQSCMAQLLIKYLAEQTTYRFLFETVAPENIPSIKSVLKTGLVMVLLKQKYGGLERYIFFRDLASPMALQAATEHIVDLRDREQQVTFFSEGYVAYKVDHSEQGVKLTFAMPEAALFL